MDRNTAQLLRRARIILRCGLVGLVASLLCACAGKRWVDENCKRDGGVRISRHVSADGIWVDQDLASNSCLLCNELVARGVFRYVDFKSTINLPRIGMPAGHYRVTLARRGDPACRNSPGASGLAADACLALELLPGRPTEGYVFRETSDSGKREPGGYTPIANYRWTYEVSEVLSGETVATFRRYTHASYLTRHSGGTMSFYACPEGFPTTVEFLRAVLNQ